MSLISSSSQSNGPLLPLAAMLAAGFFCTSAYGQRSQPIDAGSLRGRRICNPLTLSSATPHIIWNNTTRCLEAGLIVGGVTSVFGRTGSVTAQGGDYTAAQVTNAFDITANNDIGAHYIDGTAGSAPANPAAGKYRVYFKTGTGWCQRDSAGTETCIGSISVEGGPTGTITVNCAVTPCQIDATAAVSLLASAETYTGLKTFDQRQVWKQVATPSAPGAGYTALYTKSDGKLYRFPNGGAETEVGAGVTVSTAGKGYFCLFDGCGFQDNPLALSSKVPRYVQFVVTAGSWTFTKAGTYNWTADSSTCTGTCGLAAALYDSDCNKISGGDFTTRTTGLTATGVQTLAHPSSVTLTPGVYFFGFASDSATLAIYGTPGNSAFRQVVNVTAGQERYFTGSNAATGDSSTLAMPSSCGTRTAVASAAVEQWVFLP